MNAKLCVFVMIFLHSSFLWNTINASYRTDAETILKTILSNKAVVHRVSWVSTKTDNQGIVHVKFIQTYKNSGIPILNGNAIVHFIAPNQFHVTDNLKNITNNIPLLPLITGLQAILSCAGNLIVTPDVKLYVVPGATEGSGSLQWLVQFKNSLISNVRYFVNALTGQSTLWYEETKSITATGLSLYKGNVTFISLPFSSNYYLEDKSRNIGTFDCSSGDCSSVTRMTDSDNYWGSSVQQIGVSVQWGASVSLDYFLAVHGRNGIDGSGGPLLTNSADSGSNNIFPLKVRYGSNATAYYTNNGIIFGGGDGTNAGNVVSLDIIGHEIMHGIIEHTANFDYTGESGAIEESYCDIFGLMIEMFAYGESNTAWTIGEDFHTPGTSGDALRYLNEPRRAANKGLTADDDPDHYSYRYTGSLDNGGVHVNSGIANKAFYLVSKGGNHSYVNGPHMTGVGVTHAAAIWYYALENYMTSDDTFLDARLATLRAARDLYGINSQDYLSVGAAWALVGVGSMPYANQINILVNGELETSELPWQMVGVGAVAYVADGSDGHSSRGYAVLGGANSVQGSLSQSGLYIPTVSVATNLTFYMWVTTQETTANFQNDKLFVEVKSAAGVSYQVGQFSNLNAGTGYVKRGPISLNAYAGWSNITISFRVVNNGNLYTTFRIDTVSLATSTF